MPDARRSLMSGKWKMHLNRWEAIQPVQELAARALAARGTLNVPGRNARTVMEWRVRKRRRPSGRSSTQSPPNRRFRTNMAGQVAGRARCPSRTRLGRIRTSDGDGSESDEVRDGDQAAEPHGAPLEIGVNRGTDGAGRCHRAWRCRRQIALRVMPRVGRGLDRAVGADRDRRLPP